MGISANARNTLRISLGHSAGNEVARILDFLKDKIEESERPPSTEIPAVLAAIPETPAENAAPPPPPEAPPVVAEPTPVTAPEPTAPPAA